MSEENVELVRRGHEAFRDSGEEAIFEYLHADIELTPIEELVDAGTFHGHDGVRRFFQTLREAFGDFRWDPQEFRGSGRPRPGCTRFFAKGRGSGVPVEAMVYNVWTVREGKATRVRGYGTARKPSKPPGCRSRRDAFFMPLRSPPFRAAQKRRDMIGSVSCHDVSGVFVLLGLDGRAIRGRPSPLEVRPWRRRVQKVPIKAAGEIEAAAKIEEGPGPG